MVQHLANQFERGSCAGFATGLEKICRRRWRGRRRGFGSVAVNVSIITNYA